MAIARAKGGGGTALFFAAANGWSGTIDILGKAGSDVNAVDSDGETPLQIAKKRGYTDVTDVLRRLGAR